MRHMVWKIKSSSKNDSLIVRLRDWCVSHVWTSLNANNYVMWQQLQLCLARILIIIVCKTFTGWLLNSKKDWFTKSGYHVIHLLLDIPIWLDTISHNTEYRNNLTYNLIFKVCLLIINFSSMIKLLLSNKPSAL